MIIAHGSTNVNPKTISAFQLGQQDARDGDICVPESYYTDHARKAQYAAGHASVRASLLSAHILGLSFIPASPVGGAI